MDIGIIIVIVCVFLASLVSLLFINKFFRGKTFEEVAAEKRALAEKLYGTKSKRAGSGSKKISSTTKPQKRKNSSPKAAATGILANKNEPVVIKDDSDVEPLNNFEETRPKDVLELKRSVKESSSDLPPQKVKSIKQAPVKEPKKVKQIKKEITTAVKDVTAAEKIEVSSSDETDRVKETKNPDEKVVVFKQTESPKMQNKPPKPKRKLENNNPAPAPTPVKKDLPVPTVNSIMSLLNRCEFTRGEIQILIDYLLNKQQDSTANHSEWSDDIVQKLRKKLEEKEREVREEQAASIGIQEKLRELRTTINTERVQHNAAIKAYIDEIQAQKMEIQNLTQDMNERIDKLKEQYNLLKMQNEHFNPQLLLAQINLLNQFKDGSKRSAFINQILTIIQPQNDELIQLKNENLALHNDIMMLNQQKESLVISLTESENKLMMQVKEKEDEKANLQIQLGNLQSALDAAKNELILLQNTSQNHVHNVHSMTSQIEELNRQMNIVNSKYIEQAGEANELRGILNTYKTTIQEKEQKIAEFEANIRNLINKEDTLLKELQIQKEKNNDVRTKNWKLVEALQNAEKNAASKNDFNNLVQPAVTPISSSHSHEDRTRELLKRLLPEAVATSTGSALSLPFDQWIEQVISTHLSETAKKHNAELSKQAEQFKQIEHNNIANNSTNNDHYNNSSTTTTTTSSNNSESINNHKEHSNSSNNNSTDDIILENAQLRAQVADLKSVVINTEKTLKSLESQALEQESKWHTVVRLKQEEIDELKNSNRQTV